MISETSYFQIAATLPQLDVLTHEIDNIRRLADAVNLVVRDFHSKVYLLMID